MAGENCRVKRIPKKKTKPKAPKITKEPDFVSLMQLVVMGKEKGLPVSYKKVKKAIKLGHLPIKVDEYTVVRNNQPRFYISRQDAERWLDELLKPYKIGGDV